MYQNFAGNSSSQGGTIGQWRTFSLPSNTPVQTDDLDLFGSAEFDFGDTSSPLVRQGILPAVHIVVGTEERTSDELEFPDFTAFFDDEVPAFNTVEIDSSSAGSSSDDGCEEFITYIRRMTDGTKVFIHTPANEEGVVQKVVEPNGTIIEHYLNGDKLTEFPQHSSGGLAWSLDGHDGSRIYEYVDGSRVIIDHDGATSFEYADPLEGGSAA